MKFLPYGHQTIEQDDIDTITKIISADYLAQGPEVEKFENAIKKYTGAKYCIAVSSGTAALHLAVKVLNLPKGSEGITSPISFVASSNCLIYNNIKPNFADIELENCCIDPYKIKKRITENTKVLIPVDFAGYAGFMPRIKELADQYGLYIIEDAAHAFGSKYDNGEMVGCCKYSDMTIFSFHPVKTITTGEGGAITTNNKQFYEQLLLLRSHGIERLEDNMSINPGPWYYEMKELGFNYRMTDIQAALGNSQIKKIDKFRHFRNCIREKYFYNIKTSNYIKKQNIIKNSNSCIHIYILRILFDKIGKDRKQVIKELSELGIGTQVHYIPIYKQPYYKLNYHFKQTDFPNAEEYYSQALTIPLYPSMTEEDINRVIDGINKVIPNE